MAIILLSSAGPGAGLVDSARGAVAKDDERLGVLKTSPRSRYSGSDRDGTIAGRFQVDLDGFELILERMFWGLIRL